MHRCTISSLLWLPTQHLTSTTNYLPARNPSRLYTYITQHTPKTNTSHQTPISKIRKERHNEVRPRPPPHHPRGPRRRRPSKHQPRRLLACPGSRRWSHRVPRRRSRRRRSGCRGRCSSGLNQNLFWVENPKNQRDDSKHKNLRKKTTK